MRLLTERVTDPAGQCHRRADRTWLIWLVHALCFAGAGVSAVLLRFDFAVPQDFVVQFVWALCLWTALKSLCFAALGTHHTSWRFLSVPDLLNLVLANVCGSALSAAAIMALAPPGFPRSVYLIDLLVCLTFTSGVRMAARVALEWRSGPRRAAERTLIYGAGETGNLLARECRTHPQLGITVVGFVDDDPEMAGTRLQGIRVLGNGEMLPTLARRYCATQVLIAIPSVTGLQMTRILEFCHAAGVHFRTMPPLSEMIWGNGLATQIREVALDDLLGRTPVKLDEEKIRTKLRGRTVMVTGAAGSIGSEICRQVARFEPREVVGFDVSETGLFFLDRDMRRMFPKVQFRAEIGSIQNVRRFSEALDRAQPAVIYHAAAYKHVPLMEYHVIEAVENNILGTYRAAEVAQEHGVADFVMISSDKAVRPASIMGVTKRVAELVINSMRGGGTNFVSVRFGNVLGSNGSVVPVFRQQIASGGPVTVTHPDMKRYFITIPEAVQLVLQASTMGKGGEIFILDMGEPIRITDLARRLILLSGLRPEQDIKVEFTGVRPGEKIHEELSMLEEELAPTYHEKISIFTGNGLPKGDVAQRIEIMRHLCETGDVRSLILELKDLVPDFNPSASVLRQTLARASEVKISVSGNGSGPCESDRRGTDRLCYVR